MKQILHIENLSSWAEDISLTDFMVKMREVSGSQNIKKEEAKYFSTTYLTKLYTIYNSTIVIAPESLIRMNFDKMHTFLKPNEIEEYVLEHKKILLFTTYSTIDRGILYDICPLENHPVEWCLKKAERLDKIKNIF